MVAKRMWIMVSGPYTSGALDASERETNLKRMNEAALAVFRKGHVPVIGVNAALPMIAEAGNSTEAFNAIMMPLSLALAERCDACLRIKGRSKGADAEVARFATVGKPVYRRVEDIPDRTTG